jgi:cold shock CspA family protein
MSSESVSETKRYIGQVKWFNNKAGYGFITMTDDDNKEKDIFTHYSTVRVGDSQYKYLVQGEYVEFELSSSASDEHEFQSTNVTGINGGKLMCETRQSNRPANIDSRQGGARKKERRQSLGESQSEQEDSGFVKVQKKRSASKK